MVTEEAFEMFKKIPVINNKKLKSLASKKTVQIYHDILNGHIDRVVYEHE